MVFAKAISKKAGHTVSVFDLNQSVVNELASKGAKAAVDAKQCATNADVLISMLPAGKHVKSLYLGNNDDSGLINVLSNNTLVIDCSTIDAESARVVGSASLVPAIKMLSSMLLHIFATCPAPISPA